MSAEKKQDYVLDVTYGAPYAFSPYNEDGSVTVGLAIITDKCPGNLVGAFHEDGQQAIEKWCQENPDWRKEFS